MVCRVLIALLFAQVLPLSIPVFASTNDLEDAIRTKDIDLVVLVDQSTSLSESDVQSEREAILAIIGTPVLYGQSIRIQIMPFSSGPFSPTILAECALTELDSAGAQFLAEKCVPQIRREPRDDGPDGKGNTDFASAIRAGLQSLKENSNSTRRQAILLLTDGKYDPIGNGSPTEVENQNLNSALQNAANERVQIWPLGFGDKVELGALIDYAAKGYQGEKDCPAPKPLIVDVATLSVEIYEVLEDIICVDIPPPAPTPGTINVHPLLNLITIDVLGSSEEPKLRDANGAIVCSGEWSRIQNSYRCQLRLDGSNPGIWQIFATEGAQFNFQSSGLVEIELSECEETPVLQVKRQDGFPAQWEFEPPKDSNWELRWPKALISFKNKMGEASLNPTEVELDVQEISIPVGPGVSSLRAELAKDSIDGISIVKIAECEIGATPQSTTSVSPEDKGDGKTEDTREPKQEEKSEEDSKFPWIVLIAGVLAIAGVIFGLKQRRINRTFPDGTIVKQLNPNSQVMLEIPNVDPSGLREFGLKIPSQGWRVQESDVSEADLVLRRDGSEVVVRGPVNHEVSEENDLDDGEKRFPLNDRFRIGNLEFIIEVPEDFEEIMEEEEQ